MIPQEARRLMDLYMATARETESETVAEANISMLAGMLGYAVSRGDITAIEHSNEWTLVKLIREERAQARREQCSA